MSYAVIISFSQKHLHFIHSTENGN